MTRLHAVADLPVVDERAELPGGFLAGGLSAGIKPSGRPDLGVIVATGSAPAAHP